MQPRLLPQPGSPTSAQRTRVCAFGFVARLFRAPLSSGVGLFISITHTGNHFHDYSKNGTKRDNSAAGGTAITVTTPANDTTQAKKMIEREYGQ